MIEMTRLRAAYDKVRDELLAERTPDGHWVGELSSSALSTATAVSALSVVRRVQGPATPVAGILSGFGVQEDVDGLISRAVAWLIKQQNEDGGFGDTDLSHSNIATTMLVVAALHLAGVADLHTDLIRCANAYIDSKGRLKGLRERYGIDKTFVVPIMTNLALAGLVDWREVDPLPFELACVPHSWYRLVGMPVVSYAIPALVAIGQARYHHAPPRNPLTRLVRRISINRSLKVLRGMQPDSGGYLEATPLTSFVVMSLASIASANGAANEVIREGVKFLVSSIRPDGSWPIDTNLATWNTTLAINALAGAGEDLAAILRINEETVRSASDAYMRGGSATAAEAKRGNSLSWLLSCQHLRRHPFTGASAGGFGWSDLSGAVPDADDTPGAVLALGALVQLDMREPGFRRNLIGNALGFKALGWLISLQNRDGGWPTFCRGWGKLPFDRSGTDLTAHALRAVTVTRDRFAANGDTHSVMWLQRLVDQVGPRGLAFLSSHQHTHGSWSPLWFGNQDDPSEDNLVYGTAKVLMAYRDLGLMDSTEARRGVAWLVANQNEDGGWGSGVWGKVRSAECGVRGAAETERRIEIGVQSLGEPVLSTEYSVSTDGNSANQNPKSKIQNLKSSVEETALAIEALLAANNDPNVAATVARGLTWLVERVECNQHRRPAPIGFYFAKLWYYERLYPLTFTVAALGRACRQFAHPTASTPIAANTASSAAP
jgi:squalene-hopene/tetraprenyl-beta-curcumene cyclase